jgi:hypothetical protein
MLSTPQMRKMVLRHLGCEGPMSVSDLTAIIHGRPEGRPDGRRREWQAWHRAALETGYAVADLEHAGRIVRVRTRRDVFYMLPVDAETLAAEVRRGLDYALERQLYPDTA